MTTEASAYVGYNPYEALCPCCGEMICLKCTEIDAKLGGLCEGDGCAPRIRRLERTQATHVAKHHDPTPAPIHAEAQSDEGDDDLGALHDLLMLVDVEPGWNEINRWTLEQRKEAIAWAAATYASASDNPVRVPAKPAFLPPGETEKRLTQA